MMKSGMMVEILSYAHPMMRPGYDTLARDRVIEHIHRTEDEITTESQHHLQFRMRNIHHRSGDKTDRVTATNNIAQVSTNEYTGESDSAEK